MKALATLLLLAAAPAPVDHPHTYLASIVDIPLKPGDRIDGFSIATWGVRFSSVCHIPYGWTVKAGSSATPEGVLEGNASLGTTWLNDKSSSELKDFVLVTLYAPVQRHDIGKENGPIYVPATFKGHADVWNDDSQRRVRLTFANVSLKPASHCPSATR